MVTISLFKLKIPVVVNPPLGFCSILPVKPLNQGKSSVKFSLFILFFNY